MFWYRLENVKRLRNKDGGSARYSVLGYGMAGAQSALRLVYRRLSIGEPTDITVPKSG